MAPRDPGQPIDRHLDWFTVHPPCPNVLSSPTDRASLRDQGIAQLKRYNVLALAGGEATVVDGDGHVLPSIGFGSSSTLPPIDTLRRLHAEGRALAFSEVTTQYAGIAPDDPRMEPYFAFQRLIDAGFEKRIMFGSDNMVWPDAIDGHRPCESRAISDRGSEAVDPSRQCRKFSPHSRLTAQLRNESIGTRKFSCAFVHLESRNTDAV